MTGESLNITQDNLDKLQQLFPDIFSEGKIDMEKFKAAFSSDINFANERYVLNWAGKSDAFKVLQIPTTATLKPQPEQSINFDTTENVFIEGENLEVLKVLQKSYYNKIKCIIIDPPYNTGNDSFIYPDSFKENKADYEKRIGDKDEEGYLMKEGMFRKNSKDSGHFHSNWLSMMYPRLFLAKNLLRDDGVIFVHIDDNEVHNLRLLMNEIFGEENFVASFIWDGGRKNDAKKVSVGHEYILAFAKRNSNEKDENDESTTVWKERKEGIDEIYAKYELFSKQHSRNWELVSKAIQEWYKTLKESHPSKSHEHYKCADEKGIYFPSDLSGPDDGRKNRPRYEVLHPVTKKPVPVPARGWRWEKPRMEEELKKGRVHFGIDETSIPNSKVYLKENEYQAPSSVFYKDRRSSSGSLKQLMGDKVFDFPKDVSVTKRLLNLVMNDGDIALDFFAGSGTVGESILEFNREKKFNTKFLLIQLPEPIEEDSRPFNAGYKTISEISKERIRRVIQKIDKEAKEKPELFDTNNLDLGFKVFKLSPSNFKIWRVSEITKENLVEQLDAFTNPVRAESKNENILFELILKAGYLLTDKVEVKEKFYSVNDGELIIALEEMNQKIIDTIIKAQPKKVITLDNLFSGNDQLKTNTVLQMKDAGIDFKTI
jgi:adenine-specific DNA-methyltransferase